MTPVRDHWTARVADRDLKRGQREYAEARVRTIDRSWDERLRSCSTRGVEVKCLCDGTEFRPYTCRQHWVCRTCLADRTRRNAPRIREALNAQWERATQGSFRHRYIVLITLTTKHTGNLSDDRDMLAKGWRGLYRRMHRAGWGKFPYVGVWEMTPGEDGLGHVHAHIVAVWPFHDWSQVSQWWREECPGSSHISLEASKSPRDAAHYVSKYLSKGVELDEFTPEMRADALAAFYGKQCVFSSKGFFLKWDGCCPDCACPKRRVVRNPFDGAPALGGWVSGGLDPPDDSCGDGKQLAISLQRAGVSSSDGIH